MSPSVRSVPALAHLGSLVTRLGSGGGAVCQMSFDQQGGTHCGNQRCGDVGCPELANHLVTQDTVTPLTRGDHNIVPWS